MESFIRFGYRFAIEHFYSPLKCNLLEFNETPFAIRFCNEAFEETESFVSKNARISIRFACLRALCTVLDRVNHLARENTGEKVNRRAKQTAK